MVSRKDDPTYKIADLLRAADNQFTSLSVKDANGNIAKFMVEGYVTDFKKVYPEQKTSTKGNEYTRYKQKITIADDQGNEIKALIVPINADCSVTQTGQFVRLVNCTANIYNDVRELAWCDISYPPNPGGGLPPAPSNVPAQTAPANRAGRLPNPAVAQAAVNSRAPLVPGGDSRKDVLIVRQCIAKLWQDKPESFDNAQADLIYDWVIGNIPPVKRGPAPQSGNPIPETAPEPVTPQQKFENNVDRDIPF